MQGQVPESALVVEEVQLFFSKLDRALLDVGLQEQLIRREHRADRSSEGCRSTATRNSAKHEAALPLR